MLSKKDLVSMDNNQLIGPGNARGVYGDFEKFNKERFYENLKLHNISQDVLDEVQRAVSMHGPMNSAHEAYAVLLEEVDELWDEVKKKSSVRSKAKMREEAVQIAAMAIRFIHDVVDKEK